MDNKRMKYLQEAHAKYSSYGEQAESQHQKALVAHHHPYSRQYKVYRKFFDSLNYASGEGKRYYSFIDEQNCSQYARPFLLVKGAYVAREVLRGRLTAYEFIKRLAANHWPAEAEAGLYYGGFLVTTTHPAMAEALERLMGHEDTRWQEKNAQCFFFPLRNEETFATIKGVIDAFHAGYLLHPETRQETAGSDDQKQTIDLAELHRIAAQDAWL